MDKGDRGLVVLGTRSDVHVDRVVAEMEKRGDTRVFVMDYHDGTRTSVHVGEAGELDVRVNGMRLPSNVLVWDRTKILPGSRLYIRGDDPVSADYVAQEWRALFTLVSGLYGDRVVNPLSSKRCMIKPYQQRVAASVGLRVPVTLVTNDRASAMEFSRGSPVGTIMKSLSAGKVMPRDGAPYNVMTMRVDASDLAAGSEEEFAYCPHFIQHEIRKSYELRVVVVGSQMLPFRIESQALRSSEVDWRKGTGLIDFTPCALDPAVAAMLREFMSKMGFFSGSIDLMVDRDGETWFLECNQDGAWGWLDDIASGGITRAFVQEFSRRLDASGR